MSFKANPTLKAGKRNIYCPYYDSCLDYSAKRNWQYWDCSQCPHKHLQKSLSQDHVLVKDAAPFYELPSGVSMYVN
jgi:hypothetical protein